jgi:hypothetical protein
VSEDNRAEDGEAISRDDCPLNGAITVWAESIDPKGHLIKNDDEFDASVRCGARLTADSTMVTDAIGWEDTNTFLSARKGHGTDNYRCRAVRVAYAIGVKCSPDFSSDWATHLAQDIALLSNWRLDGFHPVGFSVTLRDKAGRVYEGGDKGPVTKGGGVFK